MQALIASEYPSRLKKIELQQVNSWPMINVTCFPQLKENKQQQISAIAPGPHTH
jgi:hypothetical protein